MTSSKSTAARELQQLIGKERFRDLKRQGYFTFHGSKGGAYALAQNGALAKQIGDPTQWQNLCVMANTVEMVPREDHIMTLYQWLVHDEVHLLQTANPKTRGTLRQALGIEVLAPPRPAAAPAARAAPTPRPAQIIYISNAVEAERLPPTYFRDVRQMGLVVYGESLAPRTGPNAIIRPMALRDWGRAGWRVTSDPDGHARITGLCPRDAVMLITGLQVDHRDPVQVQQVDIVVGGTRVCRLETAHFYLPMPPREDSQQPFQFIPLRYLESPVVVQPEMLWELILQLSGPGECTFRPVAELVEAVGATLNT